MARPWVKLSLCQYEKLNGLKKETGRPLSEIIWKAVYEFVKKKDFPVSSNASYLPKGTRDKYKSVSVYFLRSDWSLLEEISKNTGRAKSQYLSIWLRGIMLVFLLQRFLFVGSFATSSQG